MMLHMAFKFLHHFAWPLLALVYPLCASIQAIETDSNAETKNLISYWILLSFIYLFEYAFINLLPWFQLWLYIKLMIIFWLTIPDFGQASYVYNNLIRSLKLQIVTWRLNNHRMKWLFEKDNFLMHAEIYVKVNGTEALEKLIASKTNEERVQIEQKDIKDLEAIEKKEISVQTNEEVQTESKDIKDLEAIEKTEIHVQTDEQIQTENKDIKDLEATEKTEIPAAKQRTYANIVASQKASSAAIVEANGTAESERAGGEVVQSSNSIEKEVQREWTCALCLVKVTCEKTLNSHLKGKKHRAACEEALKLKMPPSLPKKLTEPIRIVNSKIICKACNVMLPSNDCVVSHIKGRKHMSNLQS